eukprot:gene20016-60068_t
MPIQGALPATMDGIGADDAALRALAGARPGTSPPRRGALTHPATADA